MHAPSPCWQALIIIIILECFTFCWALQAAHQIAAAASSNAYNEQYPSPYTVEAVRQGMDLPWWQKLAGIRFKDGKLQLAQLTVRPPECPPFSIMGCMIAVKYQNAGEGGAAPCVCGFAVGLASASVGLYLKE